MHLSLRMQDLKAQPESSSPTADCDLVGNLATDVAKRGRFRRLAEQFRTMASDVRAEIPLREQG